MHKSILQLVENSENQVTSKHVHRKYIRWHKSEEGVSISKHQFCCSLRFHKNLHSTESYYHLHQQIRKSIGHLGISDEISRSATILPQNHGFYVVDDILATMGGDWTLNERWEDLKLCSHFLVLHLHQHLLKNQGRSNFTLCYLNPTGF